MAKVLSRKMVMKKKKNKTNNKYDFLIQLNKTVRLFININNFIFKNIFIMMIQII